MTGERARRRVAALAPVVAIVAIASLAACGKKSASGATASDPGVTRPDTPPVMLNKDLPFRYPPALYAEKVQGNVTLRLFVDRDGSVVDDSTRVVESSKEPMLDSAAIKGSRELKFVPAKLHGEAMPVSILFPVYFRHPEAAPPPGDSILNKVAVPMNDTTTKVAPSDTAKKESSGSKSSSSGSGKRTHHRRRSS